MILVWVQAEPPPRYDGDPAAAVRLDEAVQGALRATAGFGAWPEGPWTVHLHEDAAAFDRATGAPPARAAAWVDDVLHLRPWAQLKRRDLGALLRHELVHRRLADAGLRRWEEEARCLWAETRVRPPKVWPQAPSQALQRDLDRALGAGTTTRQRWAYGALRGWLEGRPVPVPPRRPRGESGWAKEVLSVEEPLRVVWPPERLPSRLVVNGHGLPRGTHRSYRFQGEVRFGPGTPVGRLRGPVAVRRLRQGWELTWWVSRDRWVAAATEGELGAGAPREAQRALASVLGAWLAGPGRLRHPGGALCPLTHCAVVRGEASAAALDVARQAPPFPADPRWACFTGSAGGAALSPRAVWGDGPDEAPAVSAVAGDRWAAWERTLTAAQVALLKRTVPPGAAPGQRTLTLGGSGPYSVEALRLAAGRAFGWTAWPSNACEAEDTPEGGLRLRGRGWGHNAGLCLATALDRARHGDSAEAILDAVFPASWRKP